MSQQVSNERAATVSCAVTGEQRAELHSLSAEIVELLYTQTFSPGEITTPREVCAAFSAILLRHWQLCCIITYLRGDDGRLHESATYTDKHLDEEQARKVGRLLVEDVEREGRELGSGLDAQTNGEAPQPKLWQYALNEAGLEACVGVPLHVRGSLVGVLVVITSEAERLRAALGGIRFVAAPIIIAVGNARRTQAMQEQHQHIERLAEETKQHGEALEQANQELRRVSLYRSLFLARMSHELRTPLTAILGFTEILIDQEQLTEPQRRFCEKIQSSGKQLQTSLNMLVDISRIEGGQTELFLHEFPLRETLRESCAAVTRLAQKQGVKVECHPSSDLQTIVSDEGKLRHVLYNFLAFAISRSPSGSLVTVRAQNLNPCEIRLEIDDEGATVADLSHVFEPVELDAPSEKPTNMNELGMAIAHRLIKALGGNVMLENNPERGLKVTIKLPARPPENWEGKR